jgi:hypothetical protein
VFESIGRDDVATSIEPLTELPPPTASLPPVQSTDTDLSVELLALVAETMS